jgi:hypothetical protein
MRVIHRHLRADELHQVLVRRDHRDIRARFPRHPRIGGNQVVGLEALHLDAGQVERPRCLADDGELRHQVFRRRRAVGLVFGVELVSEGFRGVVENHREMGRRHPDGRVAGLRQQLPQHVAEAGHGADRQAVGLARQRRQCVIGAKYVAGAVDEEEMITFFHGERISAVLAQGPCSLPRCAAKFRSAAGLPLKTALRHAHGLLP